MIGEYYVVTQNSGDQYLYVIPTVYNKIDEENPYAAKNGSIMQMYAQFETLPRGVLEAEEDDSPWYESWSCNMKFFTELADKTKDDLIETIYYEGTKLMSGQQGTYSSANN